ncbi:MAG: tRNA pseudouridine(55) synthase TruB [Betaproteobacteria bacterium]|nr:tRNA pseudouridine(55) synthase TruB [Betaproteobacteria bacterium]
MTARSRWRAVDGLLLLDKPSGITSNAALQRARRVLQADKAGHTGTLDPLASGLLPLCFGQATKFARFLLDADKRYTATVAFGLTTTTGDSDGEPLERRPVSIELADLRSTLVRFTGDIDQVPPMYSALKRDGRPLYDYARAGVEVERAARRVSIRAIELLSFDGTEAMIDVTCSKGTYIRVLAEAIGEALGCGAHLSALRRTATSSWTLAQAVSLADLEALSPDAAPTCLLHPRQMVAHLPVLRLPDAAAAQRFAWGQRLVVASPAHAVATPDTAGGDALAVWGDAAGDAGFLGVAEVDGEGVLHPLRLMSTGA